MGLGPSNSGLEADFFKRRIPFIVEQKIEELIVGDENIGKAVSVVIGNTDAHPFSWVGAKRAP